MTVSPTAFPLNQLGKQMIYYGYDYCYSLLLKDHPRLPEPAHQRHVVTNQLAYDPWLHDADWLIWTCLSRESNRVALVTEANPWNTTVVEIVNGAVLTNPWRYYIAWIFDQLLQGSPCESGREGIVCTSFSIRLSAARLSLSEDLPRSLYLRQLSHFTALSTIWNI